MRKFRDILKYFVIDFTGLDAVKRPKGPGQKNQTIFLKLWKRIVQQCDKQTPFLRVIELDGSYFGPKRILGVEGRGAGSKNIVFDIFKRNDSVSTDTVSEASKALLINVIRDHL